MEVTLAEGSFTTFNLGRAYWTIGHIRLATVRSFFSQDVRRCFFQYFKITPVQSLLRTWVAHHLTLRGDLSRFVISGFRSIFWTEDSPSWTT